MYHTILHGGVYIVFHDFQKKKDGEYKSKSKIETKHK